LFAAYVDVWLQEDEESGEVSVFDEVQAQRDLYAAYVDLWLEDDAEDAEAPAETETALPAAELTETESEPETEQSEAAAETAESGSALADVLGGVAAVGAAAAAATVLGGAAETAVGGAVAGSFAEMLGQSAGTAFAGGFADMLAAGSAAEPAEAVPAAEAAAEEPAAEPLLEQPAAETEPAADVFDLDSVADELAIEMLADEGGSFTENNLFEGGDTALELQDLSSLYYVNQPDCSYPVFRDVSLQLPEGSCTAVIARVPFCAYALLRAVAGEDAQQSSGSVLLGGAPLQKQDLLYIGSDRAVDGQVTVFRWLMDVLGGAKAEKKAVLQPLLEELGMADIADKKIGSLRYAQRILLLLIAAVYSNKKLVIINDPALELEAADEMAARRVFLKLAQSSKTVLIAGRANSLMAAVANRVAALDFGNLVYSGSMREFVLRGCGEQLFFSEQDAPEAAEALAGDPQLSLRRENGIVTLLRGAEGTDVRTAARAALKAGVPVRSLRSCEKSFML
ncbi:MAG: hypothetical protein IJP01_03970, partial [Oscillospiraceae bacterium]|nr:hypothetical protein [Oscillospiraceae bacterium]